MKSILVPNFYQTKAKMQGHSLAEMVIALGLFSFVLTGITALISHMDHKEEWLKARATTHAELDATLQTIEKFWDQMDWENANFLYVDSNHKKFSLTRPFKINENETLTVTQVCHELQGLPKELANADAKLIKKLHLMKKCGGNPCTTGKLPVLNFAYFRSGSLVRTKIFPQSAVSNTFVGSTLGIGMCVFRSSNSERIQIELEGIFLSRQDKVAPFRKMTMFRTLTKGNRVGDDVKLFGNGDSP